MYNSEVTIYYNYGKMVTVQSVIPNYTKKIFLPGKTSSQLGDSLLKLAANSRETGDLFC